MSFKNLSNGREPGAIDTRAGRQYTASVNEVQEALENAPAGQSPTEAADEFQEPTAAHEKTIPWPAAKAPAQSPMKLQG
jgi:hypothetical protein